MTLGLDPVGTDGFSIVPQAAEGPLHVKLSGSCDSLVIHLLEAFLDRLHRRALAEAVKDITLDCDELYFMSSTALKTFVSWLERVRTVAPPQRYQVGVRTSRSLSWQARSFGAIQRSVPDVLRVLP
jgi:anti-anti-sigma regulatory factor